MDLRGSQHENQNVVGPGCGPCRSHFKATVDPLAETIDEFDELVALLRDGVTYANVHSSKFPGGEIHGQIFDVPQKGRD